MKRIVSILCLVALLMTTMTVGTVFADDKAGISVKFNKYEELSGNKIVYIDVVCDMPELWFKKEDPTGLDLGIYEYSGQLLQSFGWKMTYDSANLTYVAGKSVASDIASLTVNSTAGTIDAIMDASTDFNKWYSGSNFTWTIAFLVRAADAANYVPDVDLVYGSTSYTLVLQETPSDSFISTDENCTVYTDLVTEATGNQRPLTVSVETIPSYNATQTPVEPEDPYDLETSYVAAAENVTVTNPAVEKPYEVETALIFGSSINTDSAAKFGTEITLKGWTGDPIVIPAAHTYDAGAGKTGFVAAVTSIREANLGVDFIAKAYAEKEDGTKAYGEEKTANFNSLIKSAAE